MCNVQRWVLAGKSAFMGRAGGDFCGIDLLPSVPYPVLKNKEQIEVALENGSAVL